MATDAKIREREGEALQLLMDGYSPASIARDLAIKHKVIRRVLLAVTCCCSVGILRCANDA